TASPATETARQTPPGAKPNRGGTGGEATLHPARSSPPPGLVARGSGAIPAPEEWPSRRQLQTEPGLQADWQFPSLARAHGPGGAILARASPLLRSIGEFAPNRVRGYCPLRLHRRRRLRRGGGGLARARAGCKAGEIGGD